MNTFKHYNSQMTFDVAEALSSDHHLDKYLEVAEAMIESNPDLVTRVTPPPPPPREIFQGNLLFLARQ